MPKHNRTSSNEVLLYCVASRLYLETIGKATKEMCLTVRHIPILSLMGNYIIAIILLSYRKKRLGFPISFYQKLIV